MLKSKKDIDRHVRSALAKLNVESEKSLRGYTIAKLYFKINEYTDAQNYVTSFLSVKPDSASGHRLLGQCYQKLNKVDKALESFQRSLQLESKQPELLIEICKLLLDDKNLNANKAQYWCDLAESEKIEHESVFNLRLKLLGKNGDNLSQMEERILTEISNRPTDANLRVRYVCYLIEQNKFVEAYNYVLSLEMKNSELFSDCAEWYNVVWLTLNKYKSLKLKKDWDFWFLTITCLERQVFINFNSNNSMPNVGLSETANLLFNFDQHLHEASKVVIGLCQDKELAKEFLQHFRGQFCLYAASLLFKRELLQNKNQWRETTKSALPLLLLSYQTGVTDLKASWLIRCSKKTKKLMQLWNREGSFRCVQAGRTLLSTIENPVENTVSSQVNNILTDRSQWTSSEKLLQEIRQYISETTWKNKIYHAMFTSSEQTVKMVSSHFINTPKLAEPIYELPSISEIENYEENARYLKPESLQLMTYLCLGNDNLSDVRCKFFNGLNFSTSNLSFCGVESLNQLDVETYLYSSAIQAKRNLQLERTCFENYQSKSWGRPGILPFVNVQMNLCTKEQINWWSSAYEVYKNLTGENLSEIRSNLQCGIETVRCINGPKMDLIIVLKLGNIFIQRSQDVLKTIEKTAIELRAQHLFKYGINMYKMQHKGVLEPFRRVFKYANSNSSQVEREINSLTEEAVTYLAARYFKNSEYEECIEEFCGIQLPFATYFQSEAYKKLDELSKTPKKTKQFYIDKARDCLNQTLNLLEQSNIELNHPLNSIIQSEIKNLHHKKQMYNINDTSNSINGNSFAEHHLGDILSEQTPLYVQLNRASGSLQSQQTVQKNIEMENLVKQMSTTLCFLKEEFVDFFKPELNSFKKEMTGLKKEIQDIKDEIVKINKIQENNSKKKTEISSGDGEDEAASNVLEDLYLIDDELQNQLYGNSSQQQTNTYSNYSQQSQRIHTPNMQQPQHQIHQISSHLQNPYNSPMYNLNYGSPLNYFSQYMMPNQPLNQLNLNSAAAVAAAVAAQRTPMGLGGQHFPYADNMTSHQSQTNIPLAIDNRLPQSNNLFGLLTQNHSNQPERTALPPLAQQSSQVPLALQTPAFQNSNVPVTSSYQISSIPIQPNQQQSTNVQPIWNKVFNNQPVEKGPPVNVVITSSDPLPISNSSTVQVQPPLSVTIPPQHIKPTLVSNDSSLFPNNKFTTVFSQQTSISTSTVPGIITKPNITSSLNFSTTAPKTFEYTKSSNQAGINSFQQTGNLSFNTSNIPTSENDEDNQSEPEIEYDARPDFKPIIPLPAEIEVKTGEEDEEILFCYRAKLFRLIEKEWKDRGIGDIKILKNKENIRVLMRRDQTHKICANHKITGEMSIQLGKNEKASCIWAANDFADEQLKYEKFCLRFKEAAKAKEFLDVFNAAINEVKNNSSTDENTTPKKDESTDIKTLPFSGFANNAVAPTVESKMQFSGFSNVSTTAETPVSKPSPFAGFSFDKNSTPKNVGLLPSKPFENLFSTISKTPQNTTLNTSVYSTPLDKLSSEKKEELQLNRSQSEGEDEYVPTAQFKPVIPLPELVEVHTGEENELVLFEHRAKLLRFDKQSGEWKERGLGNMKILQDKDNVNAVRLIMRREIIHKLCCNQRLEVDTKFTHPPKTECALTWAGQDFADNELNTEVLTIRFKTAAICKQFHDTILKAQENMTTNNAEKTENAEKTIEKEDVKPVKGFGDKFKPKVGSWSCKDCYTSNEANILYCVACEAPKDETVPKKNQFMIPSDSKPKFNFGFGGANVETANANTVNPTKTIIDKKNNDFEQAADSTKFTFGLIGVKQPAATENSNNAVDLSKQSETAQSTTNAFDFGQSSNFSFQNSGDGAVIPTEKNVPFGFSSTKFGTNTENILKPFSFGLGNSLTNENKATGISKSPFSFNLNTNQFETKNDESEFKLGKKDFNFVLKPKSPGKSKSPLKNNSYGGDDDSEGEPEEEENNTYFTPAIELPDKVDVKTGEENEEVLYCHRAKLFRFTEKEWKERGLGDVKILRHLDTKKLRVVMRREQILKICLNHVLSDDLEYIRKDDKTWLFTANDYSEGEIETLQFCLRFKSKDIANKFMDTVEKSIAGTADPVTISDTDNVTISAENKKLADELKLPYDFFESSTSSSNCPGCIGCDPDSFDFPDYKNNIEPIEDNPLPLLMENFETNNTLANTINSSSFGPLIVSPPKLSFATNQNIFAETGNIFGGFAKNEEAETTASKFSFNFNDPKLDVKSGITKESPGFLFGNSNSTISTTIFGGTGDSKLTNIFGGTSITPVNDKISEENKTTIGNELQNNCDPKPDNVLTSSVSPFNRNLFGSNDNSLETKNIFSQSTPFSSNGSIFGTSTFTNLNSMAPTTGTSIFGGSKVAPVFGSVFSSSSTSQEPKTPEKNSLSNNIFSSDNTNFVSFASLANTGNKIVPEKSGSGGFIGLTHQDAFSNFDKLKNKSNDNNTSTNTHGDEDENYDPQYDPIIALPKEIVVSTGEENEKKIFGERAKLYRYDANNKEWKERGVGELKILQHKEQATYRLLMRREQIHKLVLNHAVNDEFVMTPMNNSPKAFCWATMNYVDEPPQIESLAVRFKNPELAKKFEEQINNCLEQVKNRSDLLPEDD